MTVEAFPLHWPHGKPRTRNRDSSQFNTTFARARDEIVRQVQLLCGRYTSSRTIGLIISTNLPLRQDGLPLAQKRRIDDPGVAIYFTYKSKQMCFACDRWDSIEDNMQAVCKTIDAIRGIARWGSGDMLESAFTGFAQLPPPMVTPPSKPWWEVFHVFRLSDHDVVKRAFQNLRSDYHPDRGGDSDKFHAVNQAWHQYLRETGRDA